MRHPNVDDLPPVGAYEDEIGTVHNVNGCEDEIWDEAKPPPDSPSFADETSSFWRTDDSCDWVERNLPRRQWISSVHPRPASLA